MSNRTDDIVAHFSAKLRSMAASDRIIASCGTAGYIQTVLVPELATLLIRDDLGVSESEARKVLKESSHIGELLNEDLNDSKRRIGAV